MDSCYVDSKSLLFFLKIRELQISYIRPLSFPLSVSMLFPFFLDYERKTLLLFDNLLDQIHYTKIISKRKKYA